MDFSSLQESYDWRSFAQVTTHFYADSPMGMSSSSLSLNDTCVYYKRKKMQQNNFR